MNAESDVLSLTNEQRRRRERPLWRRALLISVLFHVLLFMAWPSESILTSPFAAAGPRAGDDQAAGGSMQALNMRVPPAVPIVPPPLPTPTLDPVVDLEFDDEARVQPAEIMGTGLSEVGPPGLETGTGRGDGGTAEEGNFRLVPPSPRAMILPTFAEELKERGAEIWVWVDASGRVVPDSTQVRPPTSDRGLNRRLMQEAADWVFEPARQGGQAVASWYNWRVRTGG